MQDLAPDDAQAVDAILTRLGQVRRRQVPRVCEWFAGQEPQMVATGAGDSVAAWRLGDGPAVLLVHGWEDDTSLWTPLIGLLQGAGVPVVALDLPGHGWSDGEGCSAERVQAAIEAVCADMGPVRAICTHSFGGVGLVQALAGGLSVEAVALVAPPIRQELQLRRQAAKFGVSGRVVDVVVERRGAGFDLMALAPAMTVPALFVHADDDQQCPADEAEACAAIWPGARFELFEGLGHRLVAQHEDTLPLLAAWLT